MFYTVGQWRKYSFVYDSDDGSCEMVLSSKLKEVGCKKFKGNQSEFSKLRVVYGFNNSYVKSIVKFTLPLEFAKRNKMEAAYRSVQKVHSVDVGIAVILIRKDEVMADDNTKKEFLRAGLTGNYIIFVYPHCDGEYKVALDNKFQSFNAVGFGNFRGIAVPERMFAYMMELTRRKDLEHLLLSFNGLFSDKLQVCFYTSPDVIYMKADNLSVSDIRWGEW